MLAPDETNMLLLAGGGCSKGGLNTHYLKGTPSSNQQFGIFIWGSHDLPFSGIPLFEHSRPGRLGKCVLCEENDG